MDGPSYLTGEEIGGNIESDVSADSEKEYEPESDSTDDDDQSDFEIENEEQELAPVNETVNPKYVSKDGIVWNPQPIQPQSGRFRSENVISLRPGVTRYAKSRVDDKKDAFMLFFPPHIENVILNHTNAYIQGRGKLPIMPIDVNLLYAYIGVLILAGVHR